ncbi:MAG TPA: beta-propeller domain-containing protein [Actinomycetota bacterium]|nr:beta-propeller domain-containing protein [Actinomycetota bacterium]
MMKRTFLTLFAAAVLGAWIVPSGAAPTESSDNVRLLGGMRFAGGTDLDFAGDYAYVGSFENADGGLYIFDISNPAAPKLAGRFLCPGYQDDVGVWRTTVVMGMHYAQERKGCKTREVGGLRIVDVSDPAKPVERSFVEIQPFGTHTLTIVGDTGYVYANPGGLGVTAEEQATTIVDIRDAANPKVVGTWLPPTSTGCHDINVVGNRAYCAGSDVTHILDITDPVHPEIISSIVNPLIYFHHGAVPSSDGDTLVIADEAFALHVCDPLGLNPTGAFWFYDISDEANPVLEGWISQTGFLAVGSLIYNTRGDWCTAHNFNMVPGKDWMVASSYTGGTSIIDFSDPASAQVIGWIVPENADTWSSYVYRGYIYTGDMNRGFDVIAMEEIVAAAAPAPGASPAPKPPSAVKGTKNTKGKAEPGAALPGTGVGVPALSWVLLAAAVATGSALKRSRSAAR